MDPATLLARIYLTADTADFMHYRTTGTLAPRSMEQAAAFSLTLAGRDPAQRQKAIMAALETIFDELNEEPTQQWATDYRAAGNRSLSVGDVVVLGETAWVVAPVGYDRVSTADLATAICGGSEESACPEEALGGKARHWAQTMAERFRGRGAGAPSGELSR